MKKISTIMAIILLGVILPANAGQWWIPAAAHADGAEGSVWRTDVVIHNFSQAPETLTMVLLPQNQDNSSADRIQTFDLADGETLVLEDLLGEVFDFTGTAALKIQCDADRIAISSRTYNLGADGSYGQSIPALADEGVVAGEAYRLLGISNTEGRRSNAGWVNLEAESKNVTVTVFDASGNLRASATYRVLPYSQQQINDVFAELGTGEIGTGWLRIQSSGRLAPYASVVAGGSNDPVYIPPSTLIDASAQLLLPAAAHVDGAGNTQWKTDIWVMNVGSRPVAPTFELWPQDGGLVTAEAPVSIEPGQILAVDDVIGELFGLDGTQGALVLDADTAILATSRTYNTAPTGSFGQFIPTTPVLSLPGAGETVLIEGVVANDGYRSNIGIVAIGDSSFSMVLKNSSGDVLSTKTTTLSARQQVQKSVTGWFGLSEVPSGSVVEITSDTASATFAAYLSVVDNDSTDPTYATASSMLHDMMDPELVNEAVMGATYALSTSVEQTGPRTFGKTAPECIDTEYEGDTIHPGESPEGKCWQAAVNFNDCNWTFPSAGDELSIAGHSDADICIIEGHANVFDTDLDITYFDGTLAEEHHTTIDAHQEITMEFDGSKVSSSTLLGSSVLTYDGESIQMESDLMWEDGLSGLQFIPIGTMHLWFPYEGEHGSGTGEGIAEFDGTEWVLIKLKMGLYRVSYYINIYTGAVKPA